MKKDNKRQRPNQKAREAARRKERANRAPTTVKVSQLARNAEVQKIMADLKNKASSIDKLAELASSISERGKSLMDRISSTKDKAEEPAVENDSTDQPIEGQYIPAAPSQLTPTHQEILEKVFSKS